MPGPIFANVVLVDEINRTTPRTQSALLEPMEERQATVEGVDAPAALAVPADRDGEPHRTARDVPAARGPARPVLADGRGRLPGRAAGAPTWSGASSCTTRSRTSRPCSRPTRSSDTSAPCARSTWTPPIVDYVVAVVQATRLAPEVALGASPRSMVALTRCAQARAISEGRDFVLPDDVKALAPAALAHRLIPRQARAGAGIGREVVRRVLSEVAVPLGIVGR